MTTTDAPQAMYDAALTATIARARGHTMGDLLRRSAARWPDKTAIVFGELRQTFAELDRTVNRVANALAERAVTKGDRVALLGRNSHGFVVTYFALAKLGAVTVPVNYMLGAGEIAYILGHAEATGMVVNDELRPLAEQAIAEGGMGNQIAVRGVISHRPVAPPDGWESLHAWMEHAAEDEPAVAIADDDPLELLYTSGTESRPKGAMLTTRSVIAQQVSCIIDGEMTGEDVEVHPMPLFHCAQLHCFLTTDIYLGATSIVLPQADAAALLAAVEAERATKLFCPPTVWIGLMRHPDFEQRDLSSLRKGYYGASIMPVEVLRELGDRLPQVRLFNFYGQTELSPMATLLRPEDQVRKAGSAGRAALNVETIVVDDDDQPLPPGMVGEIVHRSPHVTAGYWHDPERTAEAFRHGWFHSGDLGVFDDEGYLTVVDRKKDMIKTGGENVASREVEEALFEHPKINEVAIFGIPHPRWIEAVVAAVVPREGQSVTPEEIIGFSRERLAGFKTPKYVVVLEALPKNATGKVLKRDLRNAYESLAEQS
jgi:fatty-acyl-CoA synthase